MILTNDTQKPSKKGQYHITSVSLTEEQVDALDRLVAQRTAETGIEFKRAWIIREAVDRLIAETKAA